MDPSNPASFSHRTERLSTGRSYHFVDQIPENYDPRRSLTLLCVHGFPDFWYGWRHQIGPWVRMGARVIVPDMLGYGETDKPTDPSEYSTKKLSDDLAALLDLLGIDRAVLIGHDWGSFTVSRFALWHPYRLLALVMMSVPYTPPSKEYASIEEVARKAPNLGYQVFFNNSKSTSLIEANLRKFLAICYKQKLKFTKMGAFEKLIYLDNVDEGLLLNGEELSIYMHEFSKGMNGPLNYYRTSKYRHDEELAAGLPSKIRPDLPVLFIWGTEDVTAIPFAVNKAHKFIKHYQDIALEGRGHWVLIEAKDAVSSCVAEWLNSLNLKASAKL
ncbi:hypothetical protein AX16_003112 [Volvariella volvacea WC 439]|nr:hypothetical protein AX16_003112 [Volvariella volvacea WC 439]